MCVYIHIVYYMSSNIYVIYIDIDTVITGAITSDIYTHTHIHTYIYTHTHTYIYVYTVIASDLDR